MSDVNWALEVGILGPLEVRRDGALVVIDGLKRRQVLAVLVAARGEVVPADRLFEALWGDDPPSTAEASLQSHVSRLRQALKPTAMVVSAPGGYAADLDLVDLDARRFESLLAEARGDDVTRSAVVLREALDVWRGAAFGDLAEQPWVRGEALRLEELRLAAMEEWIDARLAIGEAVDVVGDLEALTENHPLRERFWRQLMLALYRSGRQAEALRTAAELRKSLHDQFGLELSPAAQQLEASILVDDPALLTAPVPPRGPRPSVPAREATSFIGRDGDTAAVVDALEACSVVTICGPGGVGKTRLAAHVTARVAPRFADGAVVVELASLDDAAAVGQLVASTLDVQQRQHRSVESTIEDYLHDRQLLLVIDNCEYVALSVAALVERIRARCPDVTVLATSRSPLGLPGEHVYTLAPLDAPPAGSALMTEIASSPAVQLFVERVRDARPGFAVDEQNAAAVTEICRRLDGLPLALELAAARVRTLGVKELAGRLDQRFALLGGARASADQRHRTLQHLVEWSYELLDPAQRDTFVQLSVLAGDFGLDAAEAVCRAGEDAAVPSIVNLLDLADKSMVQIVDADEPCYRLLETLREFGHQRLRDTGALGEVEARHRAWFLELAERAARSLDGPDEGAWSTRIECQLDDFRVAHATAVRADDVDVAARLVAALREFSFRRIWYELARWADATAQLDGFADHALVPVVLGVSAYGRWVRGDLESAIELAESAVEWCRPDDPAPSGLPERVLGNALFYLGRPDDALGWMTRMLNTATASGAPAELAHALYMNSVAGTSVGDLSASTALAREARLAAEQTGSPTARAQAAYASGLAVSGSDPRTAEAELRRAADLAEAGGNRWVRAFALTQVHWLTAQRGELREGLRGFADVIDTWYRGGDWANQWLSLRLVFGILIRLGAHESAAVLHGALVAAGAAYALPFQPADAERLTREIEQLRQLLDPAVFAAAVKSGAAMSDGELVAHVQAEIARLTAGA